MKYFLLTVAGQQSLLLTNEIIYNQYPWPMGWGQLYGVFQRKIINLVSESINFLFYFDVWTGCKILHDIAMDGYCSGCKLFVLFLCISLFQSCWLWWWTGTESRTFVKEMCCDQNVIDLIPISAVSYLSLFVLGSK